MIEWGQKDDSGEPAYQIEDVMDGSLEIAENSNHSDCDPASKSTHSQKDTENEQKFPNSPEEQQDILPEPLDNQSEHDEDLERNK